MKPASLVLPTARISLRKLPALLLPLLLGLFTATAESSDPPGITWPVPVATNKPARPVLASSIQTGSAPAVLETNVPPAITNSVDALDDKYRLAIGDRISFRIVEDEEDPRPLFVTDSGDLEVPLIGRYPAVGRTCRQLARALNAEFEKEYYYHATVVIAVDVMTKSRGKVYIVGPVRLPGPQDVPSDELLTLSRAILRAGGFTDYADKKNVKVTRKGTDGTDRNFTVNVAEILDKGKTQADLPLEAGDLVHVPERLVRF
jgi:protein involved in polysaccharide export with SLBB domain